MNKLLTLNVLSLQGHPGLIREPDVGTRWGPEEREERQDSDSHLAKAAQLPEWRVPKIHSRVPEVARLPTWFPEESQSPKGEFEWSDLQSPSGSSSSGNTYYDDDDDDGYMYIAFIFGPIALCSLVYYMFKETVCLFKETV